MLSRSSPEPWAGWVRTVAVWDVVAGWETVAGWGVVAGWETVAGWVWAAEVGAWMVRCDGAELVFTVRGGLALADSARDIRC